MTEIEKINEELRNYKLFKIQRINTREQEFIQLKKDLLLIKKNEIFTYIIGTLNFIMILFFIYNLVKSIEDKSFYEMNKELIIINLLVVLILSIFFTVKYIWVTHALRKHIKSSENAINYFSNESEKLKNIYENYVDNYLEQIKK